MNYVVVFIRDGHVFSFWNGDDWVDTLAEAKQYSYGKAFVEVWQNCPEPVGGKISAAPVSELELAQTLGRL